MFAFKKIFKYDLAYKLNSSGTRGSLYRTTGGSTWHATAIKGSNSELRRQPTITIS